MNERDCAFTERQRRHAAAANAVLGDFLAGLTREERLSLGDGRDPAHSSGVDRDVADSIAASFAPDFARDVDRPEDVIAEVFDIDPEVAVRVWRWHAAAVLRAEEGARAIQLSRIVAVLIRPMKDVRAVILGLAMASGLAGQMSLNGLQSGAAAARMLGKHRATLSHWKRTWQKLLDLRDETYGKTDAAKAKYREKRNEVVARGREAKKI